MLLIVQNLWIRRFSPQQLWRNFYVAEIRTDCSICQCMGPLKGPENLMSTHTLPCTLTFSQQYGVTYEKRDIYIIKPPFLWTKRPLAPQSGDIRTKSQTFPKGRWKTKCSLNENRQERVFLVCLCICCYFYRLPLFGPLTCNLEGSDWIQEKGKEHKVCWSTSPGLQAVQGESLQPIVAAG